MSNRQAMAAADAAALSAYVRQQQRRAQRRAQREAEDEENTRLAEEVSRYFTSNPRLQYVAPAGIGRHGGVLLLRENDDKGELVRRFVVKYSLNEKEDDDLRNEYRFLKRMRGAEHVGQLIELAEASLELRSLVNAPRAETADGGQAGGAGGSGGSGGSGGGGGSGDANGSDDASGSGGAGGSDGGGNANDGNADQGNEPRRPTLALEVSSLQTSRYNIHSLPEVSLPPMLSTRIPYQAIAAATWLLLYLVAGNSSIDT